MGRPSTIRLDLPPGSSWSLRPRVQEPAMSNFQLHALDHETFAHLFDLDDAALAGMGIRRMTATSGFGYPCRISLQDAAEGEELLLLPFEHQPVDTPYRASGPIFIRRGATRFR